MSHAVPPPEAEKHPPYAALRTFALCFPEAYEEFPWGHCAIKVRKKIFISMGITEERFSFSVKLKDSNFEALLLPFTEPTHYGMGKHGWVTGFFALDARPPLTLIRTWIEESYRLIVPKTLVKQLDAQGGVSVPAEPVAAKRATKARKKKAAKKSTASKKKAAKKKATKKKATKKKAAAKKSSKKKAAKKKTAKKKARR